MDNQIFTNQPQNFPKTPQKSFPILKIIFMVLALAILVEVAVGLKTLLTPIKVVTKPQVTNTLSDGSITLGTINSSVNKGDLVPVTLSVSTGGHLVAGVDLVVRYDPNILEASSSAAFVKGDIFGDYPPVNNETKGILRISGLVSADKLGFNGNGVFGTINFIAKSAGSTNISLDFTPNLTSDSNMVEVGTNKDVLQKVSNVTLNIQ